MKPAKFHRFLLRGEEVIAITRFDFSISISCSSVPSYQPKYQSIIISSRVSMEFHALCSQMRPRKSHHYCLRIRKAIASENIDFVTRLTESQVPLCRCYQLFSTLTVNYQTLEAPSTIIKATTG